jgi:hypothetical protein
MFPVGALNIPELRVKLPVILRDPEGALNVPVLTEKSPLTVMFPEGP